MHAETFQLVLSSDPLAGTDRAGREVVDFRADVVRHVDVDEGTWLETAPQSFHVRARGFFAERTRSVLTAGDEVVITGATIQPDVDGDLFDDDGPLPRLMAIVIARPLD